MSKKIVWVTCLAVAVIMLATFIAGAIISFA